MNELSVIILNYNTWLDTINEIEHMHDMFNIDYHDFIVIDNNSSNESYEELYNYKVDKGIVLIKSNVNGGYAKGNNIGLKYAYKQGYQFALVVNNDIEFTNNTTLRKLIDCLNLDKSLATINTDICSPRGKIYNRDAVRPNFFDMTIGMIAYIRKGRYLKMISNDYAYVYRPQGCCMLVKLEHMNNVEYFDESTFLYNEEIILAERLLHKNYKCGCAPKYKVIHNTSNTIKNIINKKKIINYYLDGYKIYLSKYRMYNRFMVYIAKLFYFIKLIIIL